MSEMPPQPASSDPLTGKAVALGYAPAGGAYPLYSPKGVGLATFLGSPLAGSAIMAINYRRLGQPASGNKAVLVGLFTTAALIALGFFAPLHDAGIAISVVTTVGAAKMARTLQGEAFELHKAVGGKVASNWKAAGIGLLGSLVACVVVVAILLMTQLPALMAVLHPAPRVMFGNCEIRYSGSATQTDAQALGKALSDAHFFVGSKPKTVMLDKDSSGATLSFVVNETAGSQPHTLDLFTIVAWQVAPSIGGTPLTLKLISPTLRELQSKIVQ